MNGMDLVLVTGIALCAFGHWLFGLPMIALAVWAWAVE